MNPTRSSECASTYTISNSKIGPKIQEPEVTRGRSEKTGKWDA